MKCDWCSFEAVVFVRGERWERLCDVHAAREIVNARAQADAERARYDRLANPQPQVPVEVDSFPRSGGLRTGD